MTCTKEIILAKKPAVSGTPAREANMMVMASASRGLVLPRPRKAEISSLPALDADHGEGEEGAEGHDQVHGQVERGVRGKPAVHGADEEGQDEPGLGDGE